MALGPDNRFQLRTDKMTRAQADAAQIDVGLRDYMLKTYNYMALGIALTGLVAMGLTFSPALMQTVALGPFKWVLFIGILGMGWFAPRVMTGGSPAAAQAMFWVYAAMWGALLSPMFAFYLKADIARAFFITAGAFAGTSLYGYVTKRDLSGLGAFFSIATIGILIALLVNFFFIESTGLHLVLSIIVVLVFAGLTAYETQMIKSWYREGDMSDVAHKKAIFGAFMLYGSFVTMFIYILSIIGIMRGE